MDASRAESLHRRLEEVAEAVRRTTERFGREIKDAFAEVRACRAALAGELGGYPGADVQAEGGPSISLPVALQQCRASEDGDVVRVDADCRDGAFVLKRIVGRVLADPPILPEEVIARQYPIVLAGKVLAHTAEQAP